MDVYKTTVKYKNLRIEYEVKSFRLKDVFKISRSSKSNIGTIKVSITNKKNRGIGECVPYKLSLIHISEPTRQAEIA